MNMNPKEAEYYSQHRCETCAFMCKNPRTKLLYRQKLIVQNAPWVCGCEEASAFNKPVKAESHESCMYWEQRRIDIWLKRYEYMIRQIKDPGEKYYTDRSRYRNIFTFAPVVKKYIDDHKVIYPDIIEHTAFRYGLSKDLIRRMLESVKEDAR